MKQHRYRCENCNGAFRTQWDVPYPDFCPFCGIEFEERLPED